MLFNYPPQTEFNKIVSKEKIYQFAKPSKAVKECFVEQIERIRWQYKLSPDTINLPAKGEVKEIQVFSIKLKTPELHESVLRSIDTSINFPTIFQLSYKDQMKTCIAYKRQSESDRQQWITDSYLHSDWQTTEYDEKDKIKIKPQNLPVALNLESLYELMLQQFIPIKSREDETLKQQFERLNKVQNLQRESVKLQSRMKKEHQFNRKVELNSALRKIQTEIEELS